MVTGTVLVGLSGMEIARVPNASREELLEIRERILDGGNLVHLVGETWVNPSQITYVKFVKNKEK